MSILRENNSGNVVLRPVFCCTIIESMQKDILLLKRELFKLVPLEEQHKESLKEFLQLTHLVDSKLLALWTMAPQSEPAKNLKAKEFVQTMTNVWKNGDEAIRKTMKNTQLVSQNHPGIPLEELIEAVQKHYSGLKKHLDIVPRHNRCNQIVYSKNNEIMHLLNHLSHMDYILQYYIALCRVNPFLNSIDQVIDQFIIREGFLVAIYGPNFAEKAQPGSNSWKIPTFGSNNPSIQKPELLACQLLSKLLTGELLGHEPPDPHPGLEPMVKDSKLEIYLVPLSTVENNKKLIWKSLFDVYPPIISNITVNMKTPPYVAEENVALNLTKEALSGKENTGTKERVIHTMKIPYKVSNSYLKNREQNFRDAIGSSVDSDLQPIKMPCLEGVLLPPLT